MGKKRYRKISVCIWNDAKFLALSHEAKLVLFFMLTHPDLTQLGALRATVPGLACELGMELDAFGKAFEQVLQQGIVEYDGKLLFWFPNFLKHNLPESPNVVKSWHYGYCKLPESPLRTEILLGVRALVATLTQGFQEAFTGTFAEELAGALPNQRTESREQEEEKRVGDSPACLCSASPCASFSTVSHDGSNADSPHYAPSVLNEASPQNNHNSFQPPDILNRSREDDPLAGMQGAGPLPVGDKPDGGNRAAGKENVIGIKNNAQAEGRVPCPYEKIQQAYNRICIRLPRCREVTPQRKVILKSLWSSGLERKNLAWWESYFCMVHESTFLAGENDRGWTANFDWVVKPANVIKVEEGNYLPKQKKTQKRTMTSCVNATNRAVYESMMQQGEVHGLE
ncbi:hypothetical protein [Halodesulfovibrio marinisediminis]|uniref:Uncharacterized protein n=1 Tax=Halodesulfovibrio marinisediminis DSM 17456 TaxID=1121457 RepID=A0A1N6I1V0_9BACT|nr:hypothetical protein [Halodesulfovibrio marinisediminis]SIO26020.1 hypothetical protein SAMN02745161_2350 [Halodesulfovibrio marinisediminis DSM 17456]